MSQVRQCNTKFIMRALETVNGFGFRRVFGLFWPLFGSFCGGCINLRILPPQKEIENRLKRTEKSTETKSVNSLLVLLDMLLTLGYIENDAKRHHVGKQR